MARSSSRTRRIFGGKAPQPTFAQQGTKAYQRELENPTDQDVAETLAVGTHYRKFPGPAGSGSMWSYHINPTSAAGATSALTFWYSNLPDPDPETAAHWVDSGIAAIDLTSTADSFATVVDKAPVWIMAKAVIANSAGQLYGYVRSACIEE